MKFASVEEAKQFDTSKKFLFVGLFENVFLVNPCSCGSERWKNGNLGTLPNKKNGKMWEFFPSGGPPPLPPVWEPHVCEKKIKVYFAF